jgi:hypothetical protein
VKESLRFPAQEVLYLGKLARVRAGYAGRRRPEAVFVYDMAVSAPGLGNFLVFCLLARLYQLHGVTTHLFVVDDGGLREDITALGSEAVDHFRARIEEYERIADLASVPGRWEFQRASFAEFRAWRDGLVGRRGQFPSVRDQDRRAMAYVHTWLMLEHGLRRGPASVRDRFPLGPEQASCIGVELPEGAYAAIGVRANSFIHDGRDITADELRDQVELIASRFPSLPIYVVSDADGTAAAREWLAGDDRVRFALDSHEGYAAHSALCLGASLFVQIRGGGLCVPAMWSRIPWYFSDSHSNEGTRWVVRGLAEEGPGWRPPGGHPASIWRGRSDQWRESLAAFLDDLASSARDSLSRLPSAT